MMGHSRTGSACYSGHHSSLNTEQSQPSWRQTLKILLATVGGHSKRSPPHSHNPSPYEHRQASQSRTGGSGQSKAGTMSCQMAPCSWPKVGVIPIRGPICCPRATQLGHIITGQDGPGDRPCICATLWHPVSSPVMRMYPLKDGPDNRSNMVDRAIQGK